MVHEIKIRKDKNDNLEVQPWNPQFVKGDGIVHWANSLQKESVTVFFPYPDGKSSIVFTLRPGGVSPDYDLGPSGQNLPNGEYPYSVLVDDSVTGKRSFVHHNDPKIILW